ncbi:MAG: hypothetical protein QOH61_1867 [Chloroflexota bacterium]|jgi:hypothetical protein|nr:hypothetical protein [Chloroflexota bacterium]
MAIFGAVFGAIGKLLNRLLNAALGWAGLLLFGKLPPGKQTVLLVVTLGSLAWVVTIVGVLFPDVGTFLLAFVPVPDGVSDDWIRLVMLAAAILVPLVIGAALLYITPAERRPKGPGIVLSVFRGYPFAFAMALTVAFLAVVATVRKAMSLVRRWEEAHIVVVLKPGKYQELVRDVENALDDAGLAVDRKPAPAVLAMPARILGRVAGTGLADLVPDRLWHLVRPGLDVLIHPSDILVAGTKEQVARARAAIAIRLTWAPAYLTTTPEAQTLEDIITATANLRGREAQLRLAEIDRRLATIVVPYEEWETLYRMRLQLQSERLGIAPKVAGQGGAGGGGAEAPSGPTGRSGAAGGPMGREPRPGPGAAWGSQPEAAGRPAVLSWAAAAGVAALLALDVILALTKPGQRAQNDQERSPSARSGIPWPWRRRPAR